MWFHQSRFFAVLLVAVAAPASALMQSPSVFPEVPLAGEPVSLLIEAGGCDALMPESGVPRVTREGTALRVRVHSLHASDPAHCLYDPPGISRLLLGSFAAGTYTVVLERRYDVPSGLQVVETVGTYTFETVRKPMSWGEWLWIASLLGTSIATAIWMRHRRRHGLPITLPLTQWCSRAVTLGMDLDREAMALATTVSAVPAREYRS